MTIYSSQAASADTYIQSNAPTTNRGAETFIGVGESATFAEVDRGLIKFDLSSIPSTSVLISATLSLWVRVDDSTNARDWSLYRVLRNWTELGVTWNKYDGTTDWTTAGCGSDGNDADLTTAHATTNFSASEATGTQKDFSLDLVELKKMIDGTYNNYGWLIKADTESSDKYEVYSSEHATVATRPLLTIEYTDHVFGAMIWS